MPSLPPKSGKKSDPPSPLVLSRRTPTLFVDFDGTLHVGRALIDERGAITLDSGRPLLEFAPLLVELLEPYPSVEIVLTTSWLQKLPTDEVISYLPQALARRVVDTTRDIKARLSYVLNGSSGRTSSAVMPITNDCRTGSQLTIPCTEPITLAGNPESCWNISSFSMRLVGSAILAPGNIFENG